MDVGDLDGGSSCHAMSSSDLNDGIPPTALRKSEKSAPDMEKRIGGNAGAMNVAIEVRSTGDDSSEPSCWEMADASESVLRLRCLGRDFGGGRGGEPSIGVLTSSSDFLPLELSASVSVPLSTP